MKAPKHTLLRYAGEAHFDKGKYKPVLALVQKPGPTKDSTICTLYRPGSITRNACCSDDLLNKTTQEERNIFFGRTEDIFENASRLEGKSLCQKAKTKPGK